MVAFQCSKRDLKSICNLINVKSSRAETVRVSKIEENVAMMNEIRGAIEAKFND